MVSKADALTQNPKPKPKLNRKRNDASSVDSPSGTNASDDSPAVNKLHLELFHHFVTNMLNILGFDKLSFDDSAIDMTKCILSAPFLMNQVLALSAFHLSVVRPDRQEFYRHHAAQLQTHALSEFNGAKLDISIDNCVPTFLFSSLLAMHVLSDKLIYRPQNFEEFLDYFILSLKMHRGVRAVASETWHLLLQTSLGPLLENEGKIFAQGISRNECSELMSLINTASFEPAIATTYRKTVEDLQTAFNGSSSPVSNYSTISPVMFWPVIISMEYIDLLSERRPEALAILSHFGALLHIHRDMWTFGNSGIYLISSIKDYLGPQWERWLRWPNSFLQEM
ncbi:hypothetical protein N7466_000887 [Penicillium verhagenii]|uniref:uncharacterized protein n=1 Tax=Penicillium verhagenii TaxID=1562060 RepID=UPI002545304C|nr:uncharacterized protein N7466_000887 [Penicillium verhagenii]KAJ5947872.1 hypothetical protein N7466_000887 [Penicillium verhagenii]